MTIHEASWRYDFACECHDPKTGASVFIAKKEDRLAVHYGGIPDYPQFAKPWPPKWVTVRDSRIASTRLLDLHIRRGQYA